MGSRYPSYNDAPPSYYPTTYAPYLPPLPDNRRYPVPPSSDHGSYYYSPPPRESTLPWGQESATGYYSYHPYRPPKDPFLEREYERERIREEVLREEARRRIIEEEVRWELHMERYYNYRHSNHGYHGTWRNVQFEQPRFTHGCHTRAPRGQVHSKRSRTWVKGVQHKIMEIDEEELMSKILMTGDKDKPSNKEEIMKKKDEQMVQTEANGNKVEINVSEIPHKITEVDYEEIRRPQALLKDKVQSPKNQEELRPKAFLPPDTLSSDKMTPTPNTVGIENKGDGKRVLKPDSRNNVKQSASSKAPLQVEVLPKDMMKPLPNRNGVEKEGDGNTIIKPDGGNKVEQPSSSKASLSEVALPKDKMKLLPNRDVIVKNGNGNKVLKTDTKISPEEGRFTPPAHLPTKVEVIDLDPEDEVEQPTSSKAPLPEEAFPKDKMKHHPNINGIEKVGNGNKALKPGSGNKIQQPASSKAPLPEKDFPKDKMKPVSNRIGVEKEGAKNMIIEPETRNKVEQPKPASSKAPFPEEAVPKDKITLLPNRNGIGKNGNASNILKPDGGNKAKQPASSKAPHPEEASPKDKMEPLSDRNGIENEGDGNKVEKPNKVEQLAFSQSSKTRVLLQIPTPAAVGSLPPYPPSSGPAHQKGLQTHFHLQMPTLPTLLGPFPTVESTYIGPAHQKGQQTQILPTLKFLPPLSGPAHQKGQQKVIKVAETCGSKRKSDSISAVPTSAATSSSSDKVGLKKAKKQKLQEYSCTLCQLAVQGESARQAHLNGKRHQVGLKKAKKQKLQKYNCTLCQLTVQGESAWQEHLNGKRHQNRKAEEQKVQKKEYTCTFCQFTLHGELAWQTHLNGKRHQGRVRMITNVEMSKKESSVTDNASTSGIALSSVKVEMDNGDNLPTKPTGKESQVDKGIIRQMQVGRVVHQVVEKDEQLWCERCQYKCYTVLMMTVHLAGEKHKSNCQKQ